MSRLGSNPLFQEPEFDAEKERKELGIELPEKRQGRPRKDEIIREKGAQQGLTPGWTRSTFIIRTELLDTLKNYAYTERITLKDAIEEALEDFLEDKTDLLDRNQPRRRNKKGAQDD